MMFNTSRPAALRVSRESATLTSDTPRRSKRFSSSARSATLRVSRSSFAMMTVSTAPASTMDEKPLHAGTVQGLGGFARVDDGFRQVRALHHRHGADLLLFASSETPKSACFSVLTLM